MIIVTGGDVFVAARPTTGVVMVAGPGRRGRRGHAGRAAVAEWLLRAAAGAAEAGGAAAAAAPHILPFRIVVVVQLGNRHANVWRMRVGWGGEGTG